jgi:trimethylamine--corrinoid protein Co-methyltransferase
MLLGFLAGADTFGHCGICGTDHAGSLLWLAFDNELMNYVKRIARGFDVNSDTLATDIVQSVGPAGNFLAKPHTTEHFRRELWLVDQVWTRQGFDTWQSKGGGSFGERLTEYVKNALEKHTPRPLDEALSREVDRIVKQAERELE